MQTMMEGQKWNHQGVSSLMVNSLENVSAVNGEKTKLLCEGNNDEDKSTSDDVPVLWQGRFSDL